MISPCQRAFRTHRLQLAIATLTGLLALPACALEYSWTPGHDGSWSDIASWSPKGIPGAGDGVLLSGKVTLSTATEVRSLRFTPSSNTTFQGAGSLVVTHSMEFAGPWTSHLYIAQLTNAGSARWTAGGILQGPGSTFSNPAGALFDIRGDNAWQSPYGAALFDNAGTLLKSAGAASAETHFGTRLNNRGTIDVQAGRLSLTEPGVHREGSLVTTSEVGVLEIRGASTFESGARLRGNMTLDSVNAQVNLLAGADAAFRHLEVIGSSTGSRLKLASGQSVTAESLRVGAAGDISGQADLLVAGATLFTGGGAGGGSRFVANGGLDFTGTERVMYFNGATIDNHGEGAWSSGQLRGTLRMVNHTSFDIRSDGTWSEGGSGALVNLGSLVKSAGSATGRTDLRTPVENVGQLSVQAGTLSLAWGSVLRSGSRFHTAASAWAEFGYGTHRVETGASLTGNVRLSDAGGQGGPFNVQSGAVVVLEQLELLGIHRMHIESGARVSTASLNKSRGWLSGAGELIVSGPAVFSGGGMSDGVRLIAQGGLLLTTAATKQLWGGEVINHGTGLWDGGNIEGGARFANLPTALLEIRGDQDWGSGAGGLNNEGHLIKSVGAANDSTRIMTPVQNSGRIEVQQGQLDFLGGTFRNDGWISVAAGSTFSTGSEAFINRGTLSGNGRFIRQGSLPVVNSGRISPGFSVGTLAFAGGLTMDGTSNLVIELASLGSSDRLSIGGAASLDGVLTVVNAGYMPMLGDSFRVIDYASRLGNSSFDAIVAQGFGSGVVFLPEYAADHMSIRVTAVPEPTAWALWMTGGALLAALARRRHRPTARLL